MSRKTIIGFAAAGLLFLAIAGILLLTGPRMETQPSLRTFESRVPLPPEGAVPYYGEELELGSEILFPPAVLVSVQRGKVYYDYFCLMCHGEDGRGTGPVGDSYYPRPADLGSVQVQEYANGDLYNAAFRGTGHSPVLERIVPLRYRGYILTYIRQGFQE